MANIATNANFLSTASNPGITYTGTLTSTYFSFIQQYEQIIYTNGTISAPVIAASITLVTEPLLTTFNLGLCGDATVILNYAPLITTITASNALYLRVNVTKAPLLATISAPNAISFTIAGTFPAITTLSFPSVSQFTGVVTPTLPALTTLSLPQLYTGDNFSPIAAVLTTLNLPMLTYIGSFIPSMVSLTTLSLPQLTLITGAGTVLNSSFPLLTTFNLPSLTTIVDGSTTNISLPSCTTFSLPLLANVGIFTVTFPVLTTFNLPALVSASGLLTASLTLCTSFSLPVLANSAGFIATLPAATTLNLNALANVSVNLALTCAILTTLSLPAIVSVGSTFVITAANLVTFSLGSTLKNIGGNLTMSGMKLNQASVDSILVSLAALDGTNGTTAYSSKTVLLNGGTSSTPSSTGLAAKATLVGRGCTVTTN